MANKGNEIGRVDVFWCNNALKDGFKLRSLLYKFVFGYFDDIYNKKTKKVVCKLTLYISSVICRTKNTLSMYFCCICSIFICSTPLKE